MLHMNIQPDTIDLSLNLNQSYNVQGKNQIQGESSFSSMLEQAQEASSTEGNQTQNLEKTQATKDLENVKESKTDEKTSMEEINSQKNDSLTTNQIDEKVFSASQLENLQNQIVSNVISDNKIPISEKNTISKDIISKIDSFVENLDLTKVSDIKELNVKNPKIDSKIIEKGDLFSIIEDLKNGTKENEEKDILNDAFPFLNFENQIGENKSTENQIVLENDLIAEIQNPEQNNGKISVIDMRTEQVAE
ncbi:MAG: hypothetical protein J6A14_04510, partial [Spirochaetaceae bacterium]|nr:hypothetical protein [Spirochaetaceae bacterium]